MGYSESEELEIARLYKNLISDNYREFSKDNLALIRKAFKLSVEAHSEQRRKSGEPYIYHPIKVANIVAKEMGLGTTTIVCALLHDVVEDTEYTNEDIEKIFGKKIAIIIDGLTKISSIDHQNISLQSENYRKLLLTLCEDVRVILIKIADRLHNMRTLDSMKVEKQKKIASETNYIYAPIAHRLGLYSIKSELEDLSLKYNDTDAYNYILEKLQKTSIDRQEYIDKFKKIIDDKLKEENLTYKIKGRHKSIFSIYKKMKKQNVDFDQIFDLFAIRVIYKADKKNEKFIAWKIYSIVTDLFVPNPSRMRDWITTSRATGYESLHATVIGPDKKWVEVQIRSERMNEVAEKGIAAHYKYKSNYDLNENNQIEKWIIKVRETLESNRETSTKELLEDFKLDLSIEDIFVFTPRGEIKVLPSGSTTLDFAYSIHSDIGDKCIGTKVNGKIVPLNHRLSSGDQVEILTSPNQNPKLNWLDFVSTTKAKSRIKSALKSEKRKYSQEGKEILERKLKQLKINFSDQELASIQKFFGAKTGYDIYYQVCNGVIGMKELKKYADSKNIFNNFISKIRNRTPDFFKTNKEKSNLISNNEDKRKLDIIVFGDNQEKMDYKIASCCEPIPGDRIFGFVTINKGIKIHKDNCPNSIDMRANYNYRIIKARWEDSSSIDFTVEIEVEGIDRKGIFNDISFLISNSMNVSINKIGFDIEGEVFHGNIHLRVRNKIQLEEIISNIKNIFGVTKIIRKK